MKALRFSTIFAIVCTVSLWALAPELIEAGNGSPDVEEPVEVGKAGADVDGTVKSPTKIKGKTAGGVAEGEFAMDVKNTTGVRNVTDFHVKITKPTSYKISNISTDKAGGTPFTDNDPVDGTDSASEEASTASPASGNALADGEVITINLSLEDSNGNPVDNEPIDLEVWWTKGNNRDIVVSATSPDELGDGDPRDSISTIAAAASLNLTTGPKNIAHETSEDTINDLTIGECDGFRFQDGSFMLKPDNSAEFKLHQDTRVKGYDDEGNEMTGTSALSVSNLRIDDRGNFVFDVSRDLEDEDHIFLVISGLRIEDLGDHDVGQKVHAGVSGAAVAGHCIEDYFHIVTIVE